MKIRLWVWLPLLFALPLLVVACGDDGGQVGGPPDRELTADEERLKSMVLATEEVGEVFPGLAWFQFESSSPQVELIPEEERPTGLLAAWVTVLGPGEEASESEDQVVTTDLFLYETANTASVALKDDVERLNREGAEIDRFDAGDIGDETQSVVTRDPGGRVGTGVFMRVDSIVAFIRLLRSDDEEMSEEVLQLAQRLAAKIEAVIKS